MKFILTLCVISLLIALCTGFSDSYLRLMKQRLRERGYRVVPIRKETTAVDRYRSGRRKVIDDIKLGGEYNPYLNICIIIHDYRQSVESNNIQVLEGQIKDKCNIITFNWGKAASSSYDSARCKLGSLARYFDKYADDVLTKVNGKWEYVHVIGVGLGAHIAARLGRSTHPRPGKITALDPNRKMEDFKWTCKSHITLDKTDADHLEVFYTDFAGIGANKVIGDTNYFPNGGRHPQPGCLTHQSSHELALPYYTATVVTKVIVALCGNLIHALEMNCNGTRIEIGGIGVDPKPPGLYTNQLLLREKSDND